MGDILDGYGPVRGPGAGAYDEVVDGAGTLRAPYEEVAAAVSAMSAGEVSARAERLARAFRHQGVTFDLDGEERPFPLDVMPRVFSAREWSLVEAGVAQRVRALEAFLDDVYGPGRILDAGVVPRQVVTGSPNFLRAAHGIRPVNGVRVHVAGIDIVRDEAGEFRVLEDNIRCPSGVSYVLANRQAMARVIPEIFSGRPIRPVADYPARLIGALRAAAPAGVGDPTVVVLTPGVFNSAFYEHALLARLMGVELVEGRDLVCRGTEVFLRTTEGETRVHVIYRRVDDDFLDPLHFRPDSVVGCPGLLNAVRAGGVALANAAGNGIADDKLVYCWVPDMIRFYLDEEPVLQNVETFRLVDGDERAEALRRRAELVFKPVDSSGGKGIVLGPFATREDLAEVAAAVERDPRAWVAQRLISLSTSPTWVGEELVPRHIDLRPFAVHDGTDVWVLPGGLTRVALDEGGLVVNSSQGGGSKDTWVVGGAGAGHGADPEVATSGRLGAPWPAGTGPPGRTRPGGGGWPHAGTRIGAGTAVDPGPIGMEGQQQ
ncbi:MAG TPA: circularly permuted type 2 ATP-grasp protein [Acidimicrobiales bacterium]|nr:circularly permuted type 2 ATP-grasp protein [Acidimicrobiales bacterium]